ncbi:MAG: hypothetical protein B7Z33_02875 [Sphingomonadales bacterium 12-68-11]|nr:MAG: hypothetical protein B7Z33_02875 [Sphingomonadales bacterium 12-68-11]
MNATRGQADLYRPHVGIFDNVLFARNQPNVLQVFDVSLQYRVRELVILSKNSRKEVVHSKDRRHWKVLLMSEQLSEQS